MRLLDIPEQMDKNKEIIQTLPENTIANRSKKQDYIEKQILSCTNLKNQIMKELQDRYNVFTQLSPNPTIEELKEKEKKLSFLKELNDYNTPYEKMHLDYYLYQLHHYYKEDLKSVNLCLQHIIDAFKRTGVTLKKEDFIYHPLVAEYMDAVLNHTEDDMYISQIFEKVYWKCSNVLHILEVNFQYLYFKYEKNILKYYENRRQEILKSYSSEDILHTYLEVHEKRKELEHQDEYLMVQKFVQGTYTPSSMDATNIERIQKQLFNQLPENYITILKKLESLLKEYQQYLRYQYIVEDMRQRVSKKEEYKGLFTTKRKEIEKKEKQLFKIASEFNSQPKKRFIFGKNKGVKREQLELQYQKLLEEIFNMYKELDNLKYNQMIYEKLDMNCTVLDALRMASSHYSYFVKMTKQKDETKKIKDISEDNQKLLEYLEYHSFTLLSNLMLLSEKNVAEMIGDLYKLSNMNLHEEDLQEEKLESLIETVQTLIFAYYFKDSSLTTSNLSFYLEIRKDSDFNS